MKTTVTITKDFGSSMDDVPEEDLESSAIDLIYEDPAEFLDGATWEVKRTE